MTTARAVPMPVRVLAAIAVPVVCGLVLQAIRQAPGTWSTPLEYLRESAAPYLLLPLLVGGLARTRRGAAAQGALAAVLLVAAYYDWFVLGVAVPQRGTGGEQVFWLVAAVLTGVAAGVLGRGAVGSTALRLLGPALLVLEPVGWDVALRLGIAPVLASPQNVLAAVVEVALGVLWAVVIGVRAGRAGAAGRPGAARRPAEGRIVIPAP